jgi:hypothetical protein
MPMHLGFITSISTQKKFPPNYNLIGGVRLGYPFLSASISSSLYTLGSSFTFSYIFHMLFAFFSVYSGAFLFFNTLLKFFIGGGFGFIYFIVYASSLTFHNLFNDFYQTPTNLIQNNVRWVNFIIVSNPLILKIKTTITIKKIELPLLLRLLWYLTYL